MSRILQPAVLFAILLGMGGIILGPATRGQEAPLDSRHVWLAQADQMYLDRDWGGALWAYREVRVWGPDLPNDDEIVWRIARCSEMFKGCLGRLMSARMDADEIYGETMMKWLDSTYGYYIQTSEGDSLWSYDKRALRELLRLHPNSDLADDAMYELVHYDLIEQYPTVLMAGWPEMGGIARAGIRRYREILTRYPNTNLRDRIVSNIAALEKYLERRGKAALPEDWNRE
jgi:hypothetical protein